MQGGTGIIEGKYTMDMRLKQKFIGQWGKHFDGAELPISFYYSEQVKAAELVKPSSDHRCIMADLAKVREGRSLCFEAESVGCMGGRKYLGFTDEVMPNFEYFLSCGIAGELEGERYKKTPELVREVMKRAPKLKAPAKYVIFKRWDKLQEQDEPEVVIFFNYPDVVSGLFTLANFDECEPEGVFAPFAAGCGSIVLYPYLEKDCDRPRAVLGMFDVSARPFVPENFLTFSVAMKKFVRMVENMDESFLTTRSWSKVKERI
jgi:uncharacterized protein (DUF169 family)